MPSSPGFFKKHKHGATVFIETGTYQGEGVMYAIFDRFDQIYSIEIDKHLCEEAGTMFAIWPKVKLINGDSAVELPKLLATLKHDGPILFWLDAHYGGATTTPLQTELDAILKLKNEVTILIDDVRCFHDFWQITPDTLRQRLPANAEVSFDTGRCDLPCDVMVIHIPRKTE